MIHTGYRVFGGPGATGGGELGVLLTGVAVWLLVDVPGVTVWENAVLASPSLAQPSTMSKKSRCLRPVRR
jgi:hypothetical protein